MPLFDTECPFNLPSPLDKFWMGNRRASVFDSNDPRKGTDVINRWSQFLRSQDDTMGGRSQNKQAHSLLLLPRETCFIYSIISKTGNSLPLSGSTLLIIKHRCTLQSMLMQSARRCLNDEKNRNFSWNVLWNLQTVLWIYLFRPLWLSQ